MYQLRLTAVLIQGSTCRPGPLRRVGAALLAPEGEARDPAPVTAAATAHGRRDPRRRRAAGTDRWALRRDGVPPAAAGGGRWRCSVPVPGLLGRRAAAAARELRMVAGHRLRRRRPSPGTPVGAERRRRRRRLGETQRRRPVHQGRASGSTGGRPFGSGCGAGMRPGWSGRTLWTSPGERDPPAPAEGRAEAPSSAPVSPTGAQRCRVRSVRNRSTNAASCRTATTAISVGTDRADSHPATTPPPTAATPCTAANMP